jgi:hypothetical protein
MRATPGDVIRLRGSGSALASRTGCVIDVRGADGGPPYLVRFDNGRVSLVYEANGALIERPASRVSTAVARTSSVRPRPQQRQSRGESPGTGFYLFLMAFPVLIIFWITYATHPYMQKGLGWLIALAAILLSIPVIKLSHFIDAKLSPTPPGSTLIRLLLVGAILALEAVALVRLGDADDHQRCVDTQTMQVIPRQECLPQTAGGSGDPGDIGGPDSAVAEWYFGGQGMQVGESVDGGSLGSATAGSSQTGGGSGGVSGDTGGDDGGSDGGGDGGGGEGGGGEG